MWHKLKEEILRRQKNKINASSIVDNEINACSIVDNEFNACSIVDNEIPAYILDFIDKGDEIPCTEKSCLVKWYTENFDLAEDDSLEDVDFTSMDNSTEIPLPEVENIKNHKHFNAIILHNLEIIKFNNYADQKLEKVKNPESTFYSFSKKYLEFVKCINLSTEKRSVNSFKIEIFEKVFSGKYLDNTISKFIDKLIYDPVNYNGIDKQHFIVILLYVYLYSVDLKLPKKIQIYEKLKNIIFLLKSDTKFRISYIKDFNIDKYLINLKEFEDFYDESTFLNYYYQNYISKQNVEKELFVNFISRLNKNISNIDKQYQKDFLKKVFMLHTILYNVIDDLQIYKTVIDFFNKKIVKFDTENIKKSILNLYWNMLNKIGQAEIYNLVNIHIVNSLDKFKKHENMIFKFNLSQIRTWGQFLYFIEENKESFNNLSLAMDFLFYVTENIKEDLKLLMDIIDLYLSVHDILKLDYLFKFIKGYSRNLRNVFNFVLSKMNILEHKIEILEFYNAQSDKISKFILTLQRFVILSNEESKKDKKKESRNSGAESLFHNFVNVIYKIEDNLVLNYGDNVKLTKKRSFKLTDNE